MKNLVKINILALVLAQVSIFAAQAEKEAKLEAQRQETRNLCLWRAAEAGQLERVKDMLSQKADINVLKVAPKDAPKNDNTALTLAADNDRQEVVRYLLEQGADDTLGGFHQMIDPSPFTSGKKLFFRRQPEALQNLVKAHFLSLHSPIADATSLPKEMVNLIISKMYITDEDRQLARGTDAGDLEGVALALSKSADPNYITPMGVSCLDLAKSSGFMFIGRPRNGGKVSAAHRENEEKLIRLLLDARADASRVRKKISS